jgi:hypothetical protein
LLSLSHVDRSRDRSPVLVGDAQAPVEERAVEWPIEVDHERFGGAGLG